mmetsp:Transcript_29811/g.41201  ORF Transcript_29811/g.41201 Transcript_29811/m.41201 type:complete len:88 (-) Transcript_29811:1429-1692(-)
MLSAFIKNSYVCARRVPSSGFSVINSKRGNKNLYKGKGVPATGRHTKLGGYILLKWKLPEYVVPDLTGCELKPYISPLIKQRSPKEE